MSLLRYSATVDGACVRVDVFEGPEMVGTLVMSIDAAREFRSKVSPVLDLWGWLTPEWATAQQVKL